MEPCLGGRARHSIPSDKSVKCLKRRRLTSDWTRDCTALPGGGSSFSPGFQLPLRMLAATACVVDFFALVAVARGVGVRGVIRGLGVVAVVPLVVVDVVFAVVVDVGDATIAAPLG